MIYSFDLDGTLCLNQSRTDRISDMERLNGPITGWPESLIGHVMSTVGEDTQTALLTVAVSLLQARQDVCILSARPMCCYQATCDWLDRHQLTLSRDRIRLRPMEETELPSSQWKMSRLQELAREFKSVIHFDDDVSLSGCDWVDIITTPWSQHA
jgi:hypothetical protein